MPDATVAWPKKTRDIHNHHMDSTIWDRFAFREDDVIVATYAKSGTTWTQHIVGQLIFGGDPDVKHKPENQKPRDAIERKLEQGLEESMMASGPVSVTQPPKNKQHEK